MLGNYLRVGDVIRFSQGSNEYVGTVKKNPRYGFLRVRVDGDVTHYMSVRQQSVERIERPVLTDHERRAMSVLAEYGHDSGISAGQYRIAPNSLVSMERRGLVERFQSGVAGGVSFWLLTANGKRVAETEAVKGVY